MADEDNNMIDVGCRIGNGIVLRVFDWVDSLEVPGTKSPRELGVINLGGPVAAHGEKPGFPQDTSITAVDADLFGKWWDQNQTSDLVTGGVIYKVEDEEKAKAEEQEKAAKAEEPKQEPVKEPEHDPQPEPEDAPFYHHDPDDHEHE